MESQLAMNTGLLDHHGLLHAHDIVEIVKRERAARSCETVGEIDVMAEEAKNRPPPHYMQNTTAFENQMQAKAALTATVRGLRALKESNRLAAEESAARAAAAEALAAGADPAEVAAAERAAREAKKRKVKPPKDVMSMDQMELEDKVLRRVQAPLNFMRNPRFVRGPRRAGSEAPSDPPFVPRLGALIFCKPDRVNFVEYEVGGVYEIPVQLCNTRWFCPSSASLTSPASASISHSSPLSSLHSLSPRLSHLTSLISPRSSLLPSRLPSPLSCRRGATSAWSSATRAAST